MIFSRRKKNSEILLLSMYGLMLLNSSHKAGLTNDEAYERQVKRLVHIYNEYVDSISEEVTDELQN